MPYDVTFKGDFFQTANLLGGLDNLVHLKTSQGAGFSDPRVSGRLVTINSFSLTTEGITTTGTMVQRSTEHSR